MEIEKQISRAFKKLKANIYYDKTQSILCQQLVEYESEKIIYIKIYMNILMGIVYAPMFLMKKKVKPVFLLTCLNHIFLNMRVGGI